MPIDYSNMHTKSLWISCVVSNFYGTEIEIWSGYGEVGNTEKKLGQLWATFDVAFFLFPGAKKFFFSFLNVVASMLKVA